MKKIYQRLWLTVFVVAVAFAGEAILKRTDGQQSEPFFALQSRFTKLADGGKLEEALALAPQLETAVTAKFGGGSYELAAILVTTGNLFRRHKEYGKSEKYLVRGLQIVRSVTTTKEPVAVESRKRILQGGLTNLSLLRIDQGRTREAESLLKEALAVIDTMAPAGSETSQTLESLADIYVTLRRHCHCRNHIAACAFNQRTVEPQWSRRCASA